MTDITSSAYTTVARGLFNKDRLLFTFLIAAKVYMSTGNLKRNLFIFKAQIWSHFLYGIESNKMFNFSEEDKPPYIESDIWKNIYFLT